MRLSSSLILAAVAASATAVALSRRDGLWGWLPVSKFALDGTSSVDADVTLVTYLSLGASRSGASLADID